MRLLTNSTMVVPSDSEKVSSSNCSFEGSSPKVQVMEWRFPWVSSLGSDFKYDFGAAFTAEQQQNGAEYNFRRTEDPGEQAPRMSAFALVDGVVHHTYSTYARGVEPLVGTYRFLDLAPLGRNEDPPAAWWRRHDQYDAA